MSGFRADMRAAAVALVEGYKASSSRTLLVYPARPATILAPVVFVDAINEASILFTQGVTQRSPVVDLILIQGLFDSAEAANAQDALVDGFVEYVRGHYSAAGAGTLVTVGSIDDIPNFVPDWIVNSPIYYATRVSLLGLKSEGSLV